MVPEKVDDFVVFDNEKVMKDYLSMPRISLVVPTAVERTVILLFVC